MDNTRSTEPSAGLPPIATPLCSRFGVRSVTSRPEVRRPQGGGYSLLQAPFVELDQVKVGLDVVATFSSGLFQEMGKPSPFCRRIRMPRNHLMVPMFDLSS